MDTDSPARPAEKIAAGDASLVEADPLAPVEVVGFEAELLARFRTRYLESAAQKSDELALYLCRCASRAGQSPQGTFEVTSSHDSELFHAMRLAHSMVGSGASYGWPDITAQARPIEAALNGLLNREQAPLAELLDILGPVARLRETLHEIKTAAALEASEPE